MPRSLPGNSANYADYCVYTIRHSSVIKKFSLSEGPHTIDTKKKPWTGAEQMIADALKKDRVVPLLFAPAEETTNVVACADLLSVKTGRTNKCTFWKVRYLSPPMKKTQLKKRDGARLDINFVRDYVICQTPPLNCAAGPVTKEATAIEAVRRFVAEKKINKVLKEVAHSVSVAHAADPSKWGLRLNQRDIMLKVGFVEVLQAGDGWFHELVKDDLVPRKLRSDRRLSFDYRSYKNAPGCITCDFEVSAIGSFIEHCFQRTKLQFAWLHVVPVTQARRKTTLQTLSGFSHKNSKPDWLSLLTTWPPDKIQQICKRKAPTIKSLKKEQHFRCSSIDMNAIRRQEKSAFGITALFVSPAA
jgi:hypothetical protein